MALFETQPHPHAVRMAVREDVTYPNRAVEAQTIQSVDEQVLKAVRTYEQTLVEQADNLLVKAKVDETAAVDIIAAIRAEIVAPLTDGALPSRDSAQRFEQLRALANKAKRELAKADADAEYLSTKANDPYQALSEMWQKWPMLRPTIIAR